MRRILLIAKRDYLTSIRSKAFIIGLIVAPILFGGGFLGMALLRARPDIKDRRVAILDRTGAAAELVIEAAREQNAKELFDKTTGKQQAPRYLFERAEAASDVNAERLALSDRVRGGELFAFVEIGPEAMHPPDDTATGEKAAARRAGYFTNASGLDSSREWIADAVNDGLRRARLAQLGVDQSHFRDLLRTVTVERMGLIARDPKTGAIGAAHKRGELEGFAVPFTVVTLLMMIVLVGASPMLPAVAEDKTQRVFEMLLGVATPFELMIGKVLAAMARSITSSVFYVIGGTFVLVGLSLTALVPLSLYFWFFVYLLAELLMLCALAAALGAACSSPQDAQNLGLLLVSPVLVPYFFLMPVLSQPNGTFATALSLFPPFTPLLMLLRETLPGGIPVWQPWAGLVGVLAFALAMTWAAARIFRVGILLQGKTPKPADLVRWAVRG